MAKLDWSILQKLCNNTRKFIVYVKNYEASLDMNHLGLQLNSLDKDLFDSRQKAKRTTNFKKQVNLILLNFDIASPDSRRKANQNLKTFYQNIFPPKPKCFKCTKTIDLRKIFLDFLGNRRWKKTSTKAKSS